ncbi:MAG: hypothetical protein HFJ58_06070 [Clostridia bacterium]|nr:hypothetical protein [Clostridia bacterium]
MRKTSKLIVALLIVLTIATISVSSFATSDAGNVLTQLTGTPSGAIETGKIINIGNSIIAVVRIVGVVVAVVILLILGIKYMMGSAEEKADYKKSMIPYIVGAVLIFASTAIVGVVYDMANALNNKQ